MTAETTEPPKLDGEPREAWSDAAQGWRVVEYRPGDVLAWTWDALAGEWETPDCDEERAILRAWALAERARADAAEREHKDASAAFAGTVADLSVERDGLRDERDAAVEMRAREERAAAEACARMRGEKAAMREERDAAVARTERAEQIAAAERRLRKAQQGLAHAYDDSASWPENETPEAIRQARAEFRAARQALRDLGVDPDGEP